MARQRASLDEMSPAESAAYAAARAAFAEISVDQATFVAHLRRHLRPGQDAAAAGDSLHLGDLYCALGCALGDPRAIEVFERQCMLPLSATLKRLDPTPEFASEAMQLLRQKLLLPKDGQPPRLAEYAGRGPLLHWVRAALLRTGLNLKRDRQRDHLASAVPLHESDLPAYDPEALAIRDSYRAAFNRALPFALAALPRRDRSVLRMHLLEGLNVERIGVMYNVHRATVARWLVQARAALRSALLAKLAIELCLPSEEVEAGLGLLPSQLDLTVSRLLRTGPGSG